MMDKDAAFQAKIDDAVQDLAKQTKEDKKSLGWHHKKMAHGVQMYKQNNELSDIFRGMGVAIVNDSVDRIFIHLKGIDNLPEYDPGFKEGRCVEKLASGNEILYALYSFGAVMDKRDFCYFEGYYDIEGGAKVIVQFSVDHPTCPNASGIIRAVTHPAGFVIRPLSQGQTYIGEDDQTHTVTQEQQGKICEVSMLWQVDPRGKIPHWVVNLVSGDQVMMLHKLREYLARSTK